jgi:hypothetical protein
VRVCVRRNRREPLARQILPPGILVLDQRDLLGPTEALDRFSLPIAARASDAASAYTSMVRLKRRVKPSALFDLCCAIRRSMSLVTPT